MIASSPSNNTSGSQLGASSEEEDCTGWIGEYTSQESHDWLINIPLDYIRDPFNIFGLNTVSLDILLGEEPESEMKSGDSDTQESQAALYAEAEILFIKIHQRFVCTRMGMEYMFERFVF